MTKRLGFCRFFLLSTIISSKLLGEHLWGANSETACMAAVFTYPPKSLTTTLTGVQMGATVSTFFFSVAFSLDGSLLASGSEDNTIRLWDPETRVLIGGKPSIRRHESSIHSMAINPDSSLLASGTSGETIWLWDI